MFKVTLKIKPNGEWVDGPVVLVEAGDMEKFSQQHEYFKVEGATEKDIQLYGQRIPSAFKGFLV